MGKNSEYSSGTGKRWAVIVGIIALVAIVVVVIIMAIPPNTYNAVETLDRVSQTAYLTTANEQTEFDKFKTKVSTSVVGQYTQELNDMQYIAYSVNAILDYHNDYLVFAKDNKTFKNNYKNIKEGLTDAKESQKKLNKILADTNELSNESSTYLQSAMVDYRNEFFKWLKSSKRAIGGLENTYAGSLGEVSFNNPASDLILDVINDYMDVLVEYYDKLIEFDVKGGNVSDYAAKYAEFGLTYKIRCFYSFIARYLYNNNSNYYIAKYYFDTNIQNNIKLYNEFFTLYQVEDTTELIASISSSGITKIYEGVTDENSAYFAICKFVQGGV